MPPEAATPALTETIIGFSEQDRPLTVYFPLPAPSATLKVLLLAGQHGDELLPQQVLGEFVESHSKHRGLELAVLPTLNPDGVAQKRRENAHGLDLNRDHALLQSAEVRALHGFVRTWRPQVVVDLHTYPTRRQHLVKQGLVHAHDVFLDVPTHPNAPHALPRAFLDEMLPALNAKGMLAGRYTLITPSGRVRHSTPDVRDARNALSLRYNCFSLLLEARTPETSRQRYRVLDAVRRTLALTLRWLERRSNALRLPVTLPEQVVIRTRYKTSPNPLTLPFAYPETADVRPVTLPGTYTPQLEPTGTVTLPRAYAVPRTSKLIEVLSRHGIALFSADCANYQVGRYTVESLRPSTRSERAPKALELSHETVSTLLAAYLLAFINAENALALATFLEPASKYGLHRFARLMPLRPQTVYPVLRVH